MVTYFYKNKASIIITTCKPVICLAPIKGTLTFPPKRVSKATITLLTQVATKSGYLCFPYLFHSPASKSAISFSEIWVSAFRRSCKL